MPPFGSNCLPLTRKLWRFCLQRIAALRRPSWSRGLDPPCHPHRCRSRVCSPRALAPYWHQHRAVRLGWHPVPARIRRHTVHCGATCCQWSPDLCRHPLSDLGDPQASVARDCAGQCSCFGDDALGSTTRAGSTARTQRPASFHHHVGSRSEPETNTVVRLMAKLAMGKLIASFRAARETRQTAYGPVNRGTSLSPLACSESLPPAS